MKEKKSGRSRRNERKDTSSFGGIPFLWLIIKVSLKLVMK
jgi:hypothetical protein